MQHIKGYIPPKKIPPTPLEIVDSKLNALDVKIDGVKEELKKN